MQHGFLVLDKPPDISSAAAVFAVQKLFGKKQKIGHTGTLDPFATGMLILALGEATKLSDYIMGETKEYIFTIAFGSETDTLDLTGTVTASSAYLPSLIECQKILDKFVGKISQTPPQYSALKVAGERAYNLARQGKIAELQARLVDCYALDILSYTEHMLTLKAVVGKGFYIRSLARDLAHALNTFGHVTMLQRTRVGKITTDMMISLAELAEMQHNENALLSLLYVLDDILVHTCSSEEALQIAQGKQLQNRFSLTNIGYLQCNNRLIAIVETTENGKMLKAKRVFNF